MKNLQIKLSQTQTKSLKDLATVQGISEERLIRNAFNLYWQLAENIEKGFTDVIFRNPRTSSEIKLSTVIKENKLSAVIKEKWIAELEDCLFEKLSNEEAQIWPEEFLEAIPIGTDVDLIFHDTLIWIAQQALKIFDHKEFPEVKEGIDAVVSAIEKKESTSVLSDVASSARDAEDIFDNGPNRSVGAIRATDVVVDVAFAAATHTFGHNSPIIPYRRCYVAFCDGYTLASGHARDAARAIANAYLATTGKELEFWRNLRDFLLAELKELK